MKDSFVSTTCPIGCEIKNNWLGTARGRIGYAWDRVMPYVTGGAAFGDIEANQLGLAGVHDTKVGWTVGGGVEAALAGNWTAKVEYLHVDLGSVNCNTGSCSLPTRVGFQSDQVRARYQLPVLIAPSAKIRQSPRTKPVRAFAFGHLLCAHLQGTHNIIFV